MVLGTKVSKSALNLKILFVRTIFEIVTLSVPNGAVSEQILVLNIRRTLILIEIFFKLLLPKIFSNKKF